MKIYSCISWFLSWSSQSYWLADVLLISNGVLRCTAIQAFNQAIAHGMTIQYTKNKKHMHIFHFYL